METNERVLAFILDELASITDNVAKTFSAESRLIGSEAVIRSRELVELLLALEDYAEDNFGVAFDWTSDSAMSESQSSFRTAGSLATQVAGLENEK